jgi:hypothetical protein
LAYDLHICDRDRLYLDRLPLSDKGKEKVQDFIEYAIAQVEDDFRNDAANRPRPGGPYFQRELLLLDVDASGNKSYHKFLFVVNDEKAGFGVLILAWIDHQ